MAALPDHALIDRLVRGRWWIPFVGMLLAGIVAMQVSMLGLGASIGRSIEHGSALLSQNEQLRATVASLADDQRIERMAAQMGMVMPTPDQVGFLSASHAGNVARALANIRPPSQTNAPSATAASTPSTPVAPTTIVAPSLQAAAPTRAAVAPATSSVAGTSAPVASTVASGPSGAGGVAVSSGTGTTAGPGRTTRTGAPITGQPVGVTSTRATP